MKLRNILTIGKIPLQATPDPTIDQIGHLKHLCGISSTNLPDKTVGLLIGLDAHYLLCPLDARFGPADSPDVIKTPLGWVLFGPSLARSKTKQDFCLFVCHIYPPFTRKRIVSLCFGQ